MTWAEWIAFFPTWLGHACLAMFALNNLYGRDIPKTFLKPYRLFTGLMIFTFPVTFYLLREVPWVWGYFWFCCGIALVVVPVLTVIRQVRPTPKAIVSTKTTTVDYWPKLGQAAIGRGKWAWVPRLPGTCVFKVDFTTLEMKLPNQPTEWAGLSIVLLSDLHFHGTPSREFFEAVLADLRVQPTPDLVLLAGDFVDTDDHHTWIEPLLSQLPAKLGRFAVLGNHDIHHHPETIRASLTRAGYTLLSNTSQTIDVRGHALELLGHEGPWFPHQRAAPANTIRWMLAHSPDNFPEAQATGCQLMFAGHVHGGQIRLPLFGSLFVPSIFGRRYDQGVFEKNGTIMIVNRGLSGKEPLRYNCHPQIIRIELK
ncbi:MAG: metallophosphoesterase [Fimbriiglobus sp.]